MNTPLTLAITLASLFLYSMTIFLTGWARGKYKIQAPAISGHPAFERAYRVQMNTIEALIVFLPSLWIFALYTSDKIAAVFGVVWLIGRVLYTIGYIQEANKRALGAAVSMLTQFVLLLAAIGSFIYSLI
jgi:glutathione S-transferase